MTLYTTRKPHEAAMRHHHYGPLHRAEKQPHPSDRAWHRPAGEPGIIAGTAYFLGPIIIMTALLWSIAG